MPRITNNTRETITVPLKERNKDGSVKTESLRRNESKSIDYDGDSAQVKGLIAAQAVSVSDAEAAKVAEAVADPAPDVGRRKG